MNTTAFQIGTTYKARSMSDAATIYEWTIVARTAKFITVRDKWGQHNRVGVKVHDGAEYALPYGTFANAPVIHADRPDHTL